MKRVLKWSVIVLILFSILFVGYYELHEKGSEAAYNCNENKQITATFYKNRVHLRLDNGDKLELPRAYSASGSRYGNEDLSFVFWTKGDEAFVQEFGELTYHDCTARI